MVWTGRAPLRRRRFKWPAECRRACQVCRRIRQNAAWRREWVPLALSFVAGGSEAQWIDNNRKPSFSAEATKDKPTTILRVFSALSALCTGVASPLVGLMALPMTFVFFGAATSADVYGRRGWGGSLFCIFVHATGDRGSYRRRNRRIVPAVDTTTLDRQSNLCCPNLDRIHLWFSRKRGR